MGRVKSEKSPEKPPAGPIKCGDLELNTAKESAKKPKFAKRWAAVSGGVDPRLEFAKSEKASKSGKVEASLSLRDEPELPGLLQPSGAFTFETAQLAESARDFTRAFGGCKDGKGDILAMGLEELEARAGPTPVICGLQQTGVNANDTALATADFRQSTVSAALAAAGIYCSPMKLVELSARLIGNLTVGAAMDVLVQMECIPQMFQNKYVILVSAAAQVESVRVLTYGFIGGPESGDRPDMKHTPFMLRLLTENLLGQEGVTLRANETAGQQIAMKYSVSPTRAEAASSEIARDTRRMAYAIATGDFEHLLEIDQEIAVAGDEDGKGFLWNVETSSYQQLLRVGSQSERTEWIDAVTAASFEQQSRSPVLDVAAISEAVVAATAYRDTNSQVREEMRHFRQSSDATLEQWTATSRWAKDGSTRHAFWAQLWASLDAATDTDEELRDELANSAEETTSPADRARARSRSPTVDVDLDEFIAAPIAVGQFTPSADMAAAIEDVQTVLQDCAAHSDSQFKCAVNLLKAAIKCDKKQSNADAKNRPLSAVLMYLQAAVCFADVTNQKQRDAFAKKLPAIDDRICMALKTERELFEELDEDQSGTLEESEFVMLMGRLSLQGSRELFNQIDIDRSGAIDYDEFASWSKRTGLRAPTATEFYRALCVLQDMPQPVEVDLNVLAAEMKRLHLPKSNAAAVCAAESAAHEAARAAVEAAALAPPTPIIIVEQPDPEPEQEQEAELELQLESELEPEPEPELETAQEPQPQPQLDPVPSSTRSSSPSLSPSRSVSPTASSPIAAVVEPMESFAGNQEMIPVCVAVRVLEAKGLPAMDTKRSGLSVVRTSDPYVAVKLRSRSDTKAGGEGTKSPFSRRADRGIDEQAKIDRAAAKGRRFAALESQVQGSQTVHRTKTIEQNLHPVWNQQLPEFTEIPP